jgi:hypothetical protein
MKLLRNFHPRNILLKNFEINHKALSTNFKNDYEGYLKIKKWFLGKQIDQNKITIYSPGCGRDFASLLLIYDALISSSNKEATFVFIDIRDFYDGILYELQKYTLGKGPWIVQKVSKNKYKAVAYFKDRVFNIIYYVNDAMSFTPSEIKDGLDIYYERAFEMFRSKEGMMMYQVYKHLKPLGLLISDYGFDFKSQKNNFKKLPKITKQFGLYNNFQIWQKKLLVKDKGNIIS